MGDPLQTAFERDLEAWLAWVDAMREEQHLMRRLVRTYAVGWLAVTGTTVAIPWLGASAAVAGVALLLATLLLAFELTFPTAAGASVNGERGWPAFGVEERARLIRIMNLSRSATRPAVKPLLRVELREALEHEPLASWAGLRRLEEVLDACAVS